MRTFRRATCLRLIAFRAASTAACASTNCCSAASTANCSALTFGALRASRSAKACATRRPADGGLEWVLGIGVSPRIDGSIPIADMNSGSRLGGAARMVFAACTMPCAAR